MFCFSCNHQNPITGSIGRRDTCEKCLRDLHCCLNCNHHDSHLSNECREPMADRVLDKDRANFCDYFLPSGETKKSSDTALADVKKKLEALFAKKK